MKIKKYEVYRDGGTMEITMEDGRIFFIANRMGGKSPDVWNEWPGQEGKSPVERDVAIEVYAAFASHCRTQAYDALATIRKVEELIEKALKFNGE